MNTVLIREAKPEDLTSIVDIWLEGVLAATGCAPDLKKLDDYAFQFKKALVNDNCIFKYWVVCSDGGEVLGWQSLQPYGNNPLIRYRNAESSTYAKPKQKLGMLGKRLLVHAIKHAETSPIEVIWGVVSQSNIGSIRMMRSCGWVRVGEVPPAEAAGGYREEVWAYRVPKASRPSIER
jgi:L-amino acid N-acyltransferase YncA